MFFRRKKEEDPAIEAEYQEALAEFKCKCELEDIINERKIGWHEVLDIVKEKLK